MIARNSSKEYGPISYMCRITALRRGAAAVECEVVSLQDRTHW